MSLLDIHAATIGESYDRQLRSPDPEPDAGFSLTSMIGSGVKGLPAAALEVSGSIADALSAFGTAAAASGGSAGGMFATPSPEEQKQEAQARDRMLKGEAFDFNAGNALRTKAEEFAPDPLTAHTADQVVHGLVRFGGKAVAAVGTMGPAGALLLGLEEGNTSAQKLRMQGVDDATAAKVGAVQGGFAAVGAVLPLGGKTLMQTLGLIGVGGPGSYIAQEALSRQILEKAGQYDQASLHNPFDPLGLALSTVIPGGFGAMHMRGVYQHGEALAAGRVPLAQLTPQELRGLKYDDARLDAVAMAAGQQYGVPPALVLAVKNAGEKSGPTAVSGKGATGVMQFMEGTAKEMGLADRTDPVASIDAGARYLKKLYDAYGSWDAAVAHYNGGGVQAVLVRGGGQPSAKETIGYLGRVRQYMADHTAETAAKAPEAVDAARVSVLNDTVARTLPDTPEAHSQMLRAADIVGESGGRAAEQEIAPVRDVDLPTFRNWFGDSKVVDEKGAPLVVYHGTTSDVESFNIKDLSGANFGDKSEGLAFFTNKRNDHPDSASDYTEPGMPGGNVIPAYVSLKNPLVVLADGEYSTVFKFDKNHAAIRQAMKDGGHDGVIVKYGDGGSDEMLVLATKPEQVKSAIGNSGKFDPNSPSLTDPLKPGERSPREANNALPPADSITLAGDEPARRGAEAGAGPGQPSAGAAGEPQKPGAVAPSEPASAVASLDAQVAQKLATEQPDLQVILPGTEERITVAEALKRIAEEQKQDGQWAELVRVAGECALSAG